MVETIIAHMEAVTIPLTLAHWWAYTSYCWGCDVCEHLLGIWRCLGEIEGQPEWPIAWATF